MSPRILIADLETSPNVADVWGLWNQNVGLNQLRESTRVICFAAKWRGERKIEFWSDHHDGHDVMIRRAHELFDEADAVVTYNGTKFDVPHMKREFLLAGLNPPSPTLNIDLLRVVKSQFRFPSNKLQYVTTQLGMAGKVQHSGHDLWVRCMAGDEKAWAEMRRYNRVDVVQTEELYERLRGWIPQALHPHPGLYGAEGASGDVCGRCGSDQLQRRGYATTSVSRFQRFQCQACGGWSRGKSRVDGVDVRGVS